MTTKTSVLLLAAAALCFITPAARALPGGSSAPKRQAAAPKPEPAAAERVNAFALKFYAKNAKGAGNLFFSPYSVYTAFAMTHEGAAGATAAEMQKVFGFGADKAAGRAAFEQLGRDLKEAAGASEFAQANSYWAQQDYSFLPEFIRVINSAYAAEAVAVDFKTAAEAARGRINAWTAEKTKGRIKELFPPASLDALTRLVLVNAVYFKGAWETAFAKDLTAPADFYPRSGAAVKAPLMTFPKNLEFQYGEPSASVQALRLPYKGGTLAMLIALPKNKQAFAAFEGGLSAAKLEQVRKSLSEQKVKVWLPKFTYASAFQLNGALAALGMPTAFTDKADFSGMDGTKKLYIQKAIHKAFVEVNEEGTEAAAATGVAMGIKSMDFDFATFRADRPFIYFIEDTKTGAVLFMGRVDNPLK